MTANPQPLGRPNVGDAIDPDWWLDGVIEDRPVQQVLATRDVGAIFRFLRSAGWSLTSICAATGLSETRIRAVMQGVQRITSYEVLERVALGLRIPRGAMGLAYGAEVDCFYPLVAGGDGATPPP